MQENTTYAPVFITTLNRFEHFKRCVDSLSRCINADKTTLYVALDYPFNESHWNGYYQISDYLNEIKGFEAVVIIKRNINFGPKNNFFDAQKTIFEKFDRMIIAEDDIEFSPNFLSFVNWGLEKYKDENRVFSICGYNYPIDMSGYDNDYYFSNDFSAWGCGIWKNKWEYINSNIFNTEFISNIFTTPKIFLYLLRNRIEVLHLLRRCLIKNVILGDAIITSYLHSNNLFTIFPTITKVKNWGFDGSGENCKSLNNNIFNSQIIDKNIRIQHEYSLSIESNEQINQKLKSFFSISFKYKLKIIFLLILFYFSNPKLWTNKAKTIKQR